MSVWDLILLSIEVDKNSTIKCKIDFRKNQKLPTARVLSSSYGVVKEDDVEEREKTLALEQFFGGRNDQLTHRQIDVEFKIVTCTRFLVRKCQ